MSTVDRQDRPLAVAWQGMGVALYRHQQVDTGEHRHASLQLLMPLGRPPVRGRWRSVDRAVDVRLAREEVGVVGSDLPHAFAWGSGARVVSFFLPPERLASLAGAHGLEGALRAVGPSRLTDPVLRELLRASGEAMGEGQLPSRLEVDALATVLGLRLLRLDGQRPGTGARPVGLASWQLRRVTDFVEANLDAALGLEALAAVVGLSPSHFSRGFKRATGNTPHQFVLDRRLERARELLATTPLPLCDIARATGFSSQSHLTALFRARHALTPARFRRQVTGTTKGANPIDAAGT